MNEQQILARRRSAGFAAFFFSGVCAISSGVVVSLLQEQYGFAYGVTGTLLSLMNIGNLVAGFLSGVLPGTLRLMPPSIPGSTPANKPPTPLPTFITPSSVPVTP